MEGETAPIFCNLSEELICRILSFLPSISDLLSFGLTCRHMNEIVFDSYVADRLFQELLKKEYGIGALHVGSEVSCRQQWKNAYNIWESLRRMRMMGEGTNNQISERGRLISLNNGRGENQKQTVGVLTPEEEAEAVLYDNPEIPTRAGACVGYFGCRSLQGSGGADTAIGICGDFGGLRIAPSLRDILDQQKDRDSDFETIHDDSYSQVMAIQTVPCWPGDSSTNSSVHHPFFLGFASGVVMAVAAKRENSDEFQALSSTEAHRNEVTCLAILPRSCNGVGCLASACVDGQIYIYPSSLKGFNLEHKILINSQLPSHSIFSMSAQKLGSQVVLCSGGPRGTFSLWKFKDEDYTIGLEYKLDYDVVLNEENDESNDTECVVTHVHFHGKATSLSSLASSRRSWQNQYQSNKILVLGTSRGDVLVYDWVKVNSTSSGMELRYDKQRLHNGSVEFSERIGNVLLTTGGKDGFAMAVDFHTGQTLATFSVHPGRFFDSPSPNLPQFERKCAVVYSRICHERGTIVFLCRDGHICEWSFRCDPPAPKDESKRKRRANLRDTLKRKRPKSHARVVPDRQSSSPIRLIPDRPRNNNHLEQSVNETSTFLSLTKRRIRNMIETLPDAIRSQFNQVGFCKWGKFYLPALVVNPMDVADGPVLNAWVNMIHISTKRKQCHKLLIFWYGVSDISRVFSIVGKSSFIRFEEGCRKGLEKVPMRLQARVESGANVTRKEQEYINGLKEIQLEYEKAPSDRPLLLPES